MTWRDDGTVRAERRWWHPGRTTTAPSSS